jgi:uncharacterized alpha-E superfamily protein
MLSRVADSAYWMSRYLERAEHAARLADVCLRLTLDGSSDTVRRLRAMAGVSPEDGGESNVRESVASCIAAARENARQIREQIAPRCGNSSTASPALAARPTAASQQADF